MTKKQAIKLAESKFWEKLSYHNRAKFQLFEEKLCMPFSVFHEAMEKVLNRPIWTHEFIKAEELKKEFLKEKKAPSLQEIINLIPSNKRIVVFGK